MHDALTAALSILGRQRQNGLIPVWFIHRRQQSSALPAEALVINDSAVVSTRARRATRVTIHFPRGPQSADCRTEE